MKNAWLVVALIFSSHFIYAQTAEDVIDSYLKKVGGKEKLLALSSVKMEGTALANGMEFPITILSKGKRKFKSFVTFQGQEIVQPAATNGEQTWNTNPMTGENQLLDDNQAIAIKREILDFPDALLTYKENGYSIEKGEDMEIDSKSCFKLTVVKPNTVMQGQEISGKTDYLIDKQSYMLVSKIQITPMGKIETIFGSYQEVGGLQYPFNFKTKLGGNEISDVTFKSIEPNAAIDDLIFSFPN